MPLVIPWDLPNTTMCVRRENVATLATRNVWQALKHRAQCSAVECSAVQCRDVVLLEHHSLRKCHQPRMQHRLRVKWGFHDCGKNCKSRPDHSQKKEGGGDTIVVPCRNNMAEWWVCCKKTVMKEHQRLNLKNKDPRFRVVAKMFLSKDGHCYQALLLITRPYEATRFGV